MPITIHIPSALRSFTGSSSVVVVEATTAAQALQELTKLHPDLQKHLFTEQGTLRNFVNIFVGEENIRHKDGLSTSLKPNDELLIIPSIAGGSHNGK